MPCTIGATGADVQRRGTLIDDFNPRKIIVQEGFGKEAGANANETHFSGFLNRTQFRSPRRFQPIATYRCSAADQSLSVGARLHQIGTIDHRIPFFVRLLDRLIAVANACGYCGVRYKPYWMMSDLAALAAVAFAWEFSAHFAEVSCLGLCAGLAGALVAHKLVLEAKAALGAVAARSFLQDCLLIIIPTFVAINLAMGQPMALITAFLGLMMPLYGGIARIGCFLGGCCYGKPCHSGVKYPQALFVTQNNGCRRFSPGPEPSHRVFPIQLLEATAQLALFTSLTLVLWEKPRSDRYIFVLYLALYATVRFGLDCYRTTSARPRYGRFSEAQLVCVAVLVFALAGLLFIVSL
jgi:phosphatidylglycerol---prolipoprotein diacylglyceryl transferase